MEVLEDVFEIVGNKINETSFENITRPDFQLPPNASLPVGDGEVAEQVAAAVTDAKFIFENVNLQQEATKGVFLMLQIYVTNPLVLSNTNNAPLLVIPFCLFVLRQISGRFPAGPG